MNYDGKCMDDLEENLVEDIIDNLDIIRKKLK